MNYDDFRLEFEEDGTLVMAGREGWQEPICPICNEPIRWVLDMASFSTRLSDATHGYCHARCVWTPEAFLKIALVCQICGEEGGIGDRHGELELGWLDLSVNDHQIAHEKCWNRDPEAKCWTPLTEDPEALNG